MKNFKSITAILALGSMVSFSSCGHLMDIEPETEYTEAAVFSDPALTHAYVNQLYNGIQHGAQEHSTDGLSDDAYFTHNYGQKAVNECSVSASALEWYSRTQNPFNWKERYKAIRDCNVVIANIDNVPEDASFCKTQMKGEAYLIRAWLYQELLKGYGGVPIVTEVFEMDDIEGMQKARNTIDEVAAQIFSDCDEAYANLPVTSDVGRVTKYVAAGLKARVALQVGSDLYADRTVNTLACNQFSGDRKAMWNLALSCAKDVIENGPYKLLDCSTGKATERAILWNHVITVVNNSEQMFIRQFKLGSGAQNNVNKQHGPNGYHNWAGTTPTHDLVKAFEFENGTLDTKMVKVGDSQIGNPYLGREPRFYATVATDGNDYGRPRPADAQGLDPTPLGQLQAGAYELSEGGIDIDLGVTDGQFKGTWGIDTRQGPIEDWNGSYTGYYEKKLIDPTIDAQNYAQEVPWTFMRLAEMYLIAAEASTELGELDEACNYINPVRTRLGILKCEDAMQAQGLSLNHDDLMQFIQHERRVEFAYEGFRYFDVRRWMIAPITNAKPLSRIICFGRLKPGKTATLPYIHNEDTWEYHYEVAALNNEERRWEDKMYFAPISREEILRNPNLEQNPGME